MNIISREACYKICDRIKEIKSEWKGELKATQNMGKGLHKVFNTVVKYISQDLSPLGESGSKVSHFITEPGNFSKLKTISDDINKLWLKETLKEINNLINNKNFLVKDPDKYEIVAPWMDVYKDKIQSDGSLDYIKLVIVVRGDLQNKELVGDPWSQTASMRNLKYFLADAAKHKAIYHQLDFIGAFLQAKVKNRVC